MSCTDPTVGTAGKGGDSGPLLRGDPMCRALSRVFPSMELLQWVERMITKIIRRLKHLPCANRLRELEVFILEKGSLLEELIEAFQLIKRIYSKERGRSFCKGL